MLIDLTCDSAVRKSDINGFPVHARVEHRDVIDAQYDILWFEFGPVGPWVPPKTSPRLARLLGESGRMVKIYYNLGRRMLALGPGDAARSGSMASPTGLPDNVTDMC